MATPTPSVMPDIEHAEAGKFVLLRFPDVSEDALEQAANTGFIAAFMAKDMGLSVGHMRGMVNLCEFVVPGPGMGRWNMREIKSYLEGIQMENPGMVISVNDYSAFPPHHGL